MPAPVAQPVTKAPSNPGALDALGDLVESAGGLPMDAGLVATKGNIR